jgi:pentatricopeptide repeat protein
MNKMQSELIEIVEDYYESRSYFLSKLGKNDDALSLYEEMFVNDESPDSYIFVSLI